MKDVLEEAKIIVVILVTVIIIVGAITTTVYIVNRISAPEISLDEPFTLTTPDNVYTCQVTGDNGEFGIDCLMNPNSNQSW